MEFKVGDKVKVVKSIGDSAVVLNKIGTVRCVRDDSLGIAFDDFKSGHNCHGILQGKDSHSGWFVYKAVVEKLTHKKEKLIIYVQDNKVVCQQIRPDGTKGFKTFANCAPTDNFNMIVGAQIALMRMAKVNEAPIVMDKHVSFDKLKLEDIL